MKDGKVYLLDTDLDQLNGLPQTLKKNLVKGNVTDDNSILIGRNLRKDDEKLDDNFDNEVKNNSTTNHSLTVGGIASESFVERQRAEAQKFKQNSEVQKRLLAAVDQLPLEQQLEFLPKLYREG